MYQYVKTYIENGAGYIILNDPKKLNALSQPMAAELSEVLEQFRFDPQIRVIVLRGEGGNIPSMKKRVDCYAAGIPAPTQTKTNMANFNHLVLYIRQIEKPVVAWIEGACAGGGMSLAMACDFAIAEENTKMSFAFSSIFVNTFSVSWLPEIFRCTFFNKLSKLSIFSCIFQHLFLYLHTIC